MGPMLNLRELHSRFRCRGWERRIENGRANSGRFDNLCSVTPNWTRIHLADRAPPPMIRCVGHIHFGSQRNNCEYSLRSVVMALRPPYAARPYIGWHRGGRDRPLGAVVLYLG